MSSVNHNEVRHRILEILYKHREDNPGSVGLERKKMQEVLNLPEKQIDFNILYLIEKNLVNSIGAFNAPWCAAGITAFGVDVIENKQKYSEEFPFIQTTIQEIHGDVYAPVIQAVSSQINFEQQVSNAFNQARDMADSKDDIPTALKEEIKKQLSLLEEEVKSKEPDAGKIQKAWKWIKKNAKWVTPILTEIVLESVKLALG